MTHDHGCKHVLIRVGMANELCGSILRPEIRVERWPRDRLLGKMMIALCLSVF